MSPSWNFKSICFLIASSVGFLCFCYIYSLSFPLVYGVIVWLNQRVLHSLEAALATAASLLIGWATTFFHCTTETCLLLAASALLYGTYQAFGRGTGTLLQ